MNGSGHAARLWGRMELATSGLKLTTMLALTAALVGCQATESHPAGGEHAAAEHAGGAQADAAHADAGHAGAAGGEKGDAQGAAHEQGHAEKHWTYSGEGNPAEWGELKGEYATCKIGGHQSPIDISGKLPTKGGALRLTNSPIPLAVVNNGHTIQVKNSTANSLEIDGQKYDLLQMHFHAPSEHTLNGQHSAMELHLVHKNAAGTLAVVGLMLNAGAENPLVGQIWSNLPTEVNQEKMVDGVSLDLKSILPADLAYYHYEGSLTTPPCTEGVQWYVLKSPSTVSEKQASMFAELLHTTNARPTQPLNGRELVSSN